MKRRTIVFLLTLSAILTFQLERAEGLFAATLHYAHPKLERREVRIPIRDFSLTDQSNKIFKFHTFKGKVLLVDFAYTTCPDVCPLMTAAMRSVQDELTPAERKLVHLIMVTTDPEIDSPAVLASYAKRYHVDLSNWSFLTGDEPSLAQVWKNFGVGVKKIARGLVDHTPLTAIIDQNGVMRFGYYGTAPDSKMVLSDMRRLLSPN
jgi:protein SCO1/2